MKKTAITLLIALGIILAAAIQTAVHHRTRGQKAEAPANMSLMKTHSARHAPVLHV